jgi:hypothetical protein
MGLMRLMALFCNTSPDRRIILGAAGSSLLGGCSGGGGSACRELLDIFPLTTLGVPLSAADAEGVIDTAGGTSMVGRACFGNSFAAAGSITFAGLSADCCAFLTADLSC